MNTQIHPSAIVDPSATIGADVSIGPYSLIGADVTIGDGCRIDGHVVLHPFVRMGTGNRIHAGAVIGDLPQDFAFDAATVSHVEIGDDNILREGFTIHRGTEADSVTRLGNGCMCMANSHVGHNAVVGDRVIFANGVLLAGHVQIGDGVFLSGNAVVHQFVRIGRLAMVSGVAGVSQDLPPFCMHHAAEVNKVSGLNTVGLRRAGLTPGQRAEVKKAFHLLYMKGLPQKKAVKTIREELPEGPAWEMAAFVEAGKRGICRFRH